jgi:hypothetical protein
VAERCSFPAPELRDGDICGPYGIIEAPRREVVTQHVPLFVFAEHNGMLMTEKSTIDMEEYLEEREEWIMMVLKHKVLMKDL